MDVSIGQLRLVGRVVGPADHHRSRHDIVDLLTGDAAQRRMLAVLTSAFAGDDVLVIRSLACRTTLRADAGADALARSIAASLMRLVRDHPTDDDWVVRFADEAAYVAAYIHDCLDGQPHRWYFDAFEPYRRTRGSTDWGALLATHRHRQWQILAQVRRNGDLEALVAAIGDDGVTALVGEVADRDEAGWAPLVAAARQIVSQALGDVHLPPAPPSRTPTLAITQPPPDWRDPTSLGSAVASAAADLLATSDTAQNGLPAEADRESVLAAARRYEWFDHEAFAAGLSAHRAHPRASHRANPAEAATPALSPRARQLLADMSVALGDPQLFLDAEHPASSTNLVRLFAALVQHAPQWHDDDLARSLTAHVLHLWQRRVTGDPSTSPAEPTTTAARASVAPAPTTSLPPSVVATSSPEGPSSRERTGQDPGQPMPSIHRSADPRPVPRDQGPSPASGVATSSPEGPSSRAHTGQDRGQPMTSIHRSADPRPLPRDQGPSPASVAALLETRFPRTGPHGTDRYSDTASGLLLLRALLDLGLTPHLLDPVHGAREPLLSALLRRWSAHPADQADPLLELVESLLHEHARSGSRVDDVCRLSVRRQLGQRLALAPFRPVFVPYGTDEFATVVVDATARVLPLGSLDGRPGLDAALGAIAEEVTLDREPAGAEAQMSVAEALATVGTSGTAEDDELHKLQLDLLAVSCVQVWARWLPGFSDASVPYLLSTVVRRPTRVEIDPSEIVVHLPARSHDIVLDLAGYLEPVDAGAALGGRRVHFVTGDHHGR